MKSKNTDMQAVFSKLSETNKDMMLLIAKSIKLSQDISNMSMGKKSSKPSKNCPA